MSASGCQLSPLQRHLLYSCTTWAGDSGGALLMHADDGRLVGIHLEFVNALREELERKTVVEDRLTNVEESLKELVKGAGQARQLRGGAYDRGVTRSLKCTLGGSKACNKRRALHVVNRSESHRGNALRSCVSHGRRRTAPCSCATMLGAPRAAAAARAASAMHCDAFSAPHLLKRPPCVCPYWLPDQAGGRVDVPKIHTIILGVLGSIPASAVRSAEVAGAAADSALWHDLTHLLAAGLHGSFSIPAQARRAASSSSSSAPQPQPQGGVG